MSTKQKKEKTPAKKAEDPKTGDNGYSSLFANMVEHIPDALIAMDDQFSITGWNAAAERVYGWKPKEAIGKRLDDLLQTKYEGAGKGSPLEEARRKGIWSGEVTRLRKDGTRIWVWCSVSAVRDEVRAVTGLISISRDISAQKQAESQREAALEKLRQSEFKYRALFDQTHDAVFNLDFNGSHLDANQRAADMLGYTHEELLKLSVRDTSAELKESLQVLKRVARGESVPLYERIFRRKDGELIPVEINIELVRDVHGDPLHIQSTVRDISERKQAESQREAALEKLHASEEKYHNLFNILEEGIAINELVFDENGDVVDYIILDVNPAFEKQSPYTIKEAIGRRATDLYRMDPEYIRDWWREHPKIREAAHTEMYHEPSGRWFYVVTTPPQNNRFATIFSNITGHKQAEERLRASEARNRAIVEAVPDLLFQIDRDGNILDYSAPDTSQLYALPEAFLGKNVKEVLPSSIALTAIEKTGEALAKKKMVKFEYELPMPGGQRFYEDRIVPLEENSVLSVIRDVTEQREMEEALRTSESRLREAQALSHMGSWELDLVNNVLHWSDEIYRIFEIDRHKFGASYEAFLDAIHPDDRATVNKAYTDSVRDHTPYNIEHRLLFPDGRIKHFHERCETYYDGDGKPVRSIGTVQDITERHQAEEALRSSQAQLASVVDSAMDAIISLDEDQRIILFNPAAESMFRCSAAEAMGQPLDRFIPERFRGAHRGHIHAFSQTSQTRREMGKLGHLSCLRADGEEFPAEISISQAEMGGRKIYTAILRDATERVQAERILRENEERFRSIFEQSPMGMGLIDTRSGRFIQVNPRYCEIVGRTRDEMLTMDFSMVTHPDDVGKDDEERQKLIHGELRAYNFDKRYIRPDQSVVWAHLTIVAMWERQHEPMIHLTMVEDITERRQAEQEAHESGKRYRALFEDVPVAIWEEDFSEVKKHLDSLKERGVTDLRAYFAAHPEALAQYKNKIRISDVNNAALEMYDAESKEELIRITTEGISQGELDNSLEDLLAIAEGRTSLSWEGSDDTLTGRPIEINLTWSVVPGYEHDYSKVIVTTVDVTERRRAEEKIVRHARELESLQSTILDIASAGSLTELLSVIVERACNLLGTSSGRLYLCDPEKQEARCVVSHNTVRDYTGMILKYGEGAAGRVAQTGEPLIIDDYRTWSGRAEVFGPDQPFIRVISVPMKRDDQIIGVIHILRDEGPSFDREDLELLGLFADHAALAVEQASLHKALQLELAERKQAEEALRENEVFIKTVLDHLPIGIAVNSVDPAVIFDYMNDNFPKFYRTTREKLAEPDSFWEAVYEESGFREEIKKRVLDDIASGDVERMAWDDIPIMRRGEEPHFISARNTPIPSQRLMISAVWDVTERKQAEEALRSSEERYRLLFDHAPFGILLADSQGQIIEVNSTALQILGSPSAEATRAINLLIFPPLIQAGISADFDKCVRQGRLVDGEYLYTTKWGKSIDASVHFVPIMDGDGPPALVQVILEDVSQRKRAEEKLRMSETLMAQAGKMARLGAWMIEISDQNDLDANPLIWSDEVYFIFGYEPGAVQVTNKFFIEHVHPDDRHAVLQAFRQAIAEKQTYEIEHRILHARGIERVVLEHADIIFDPQGRPLRILGAVQDITERQWAMDTLLESEERYRTLTEQIPAIIYLEDATIKDGHTVYISPQVESILGFTPAEWMQDDLEVWVSHIHPQDRARVTSEYDDCFDNGNSFDCEYRMISADNRIVWVRDQAKSLLNAEGGPRLIHGVMHDITESKQAEEALHQSEIRYRTLVNQIPAIVYIDEIAGEISQSQFVSHQIEHILGYTPEEWIQGGVDLWMNAIHPDDRERVQDEYRRSKETGSRLNCEYRIHSKNGNLLWVQDQFVIMTDETGRPQSIHGIVYDITQRKQAEEGLHQSEIRYRTLFEDSPVAIWEEDFSGIKSQLDSLKQQGITDFTAYFASRPEIVDEFARKIRFLNVNNAGLRMYHAGSKEELIESTAQVLSKGEQENLYQDIIAIAEGRISNQWEGTDETMDGEPIEIKLSWSVVPGHEQDYSKVIVTTIDITERRQAELALQKNQQILHEAQAMAKLGSWTADLQAGTFNISPENSGLIGMGPGVHELGALTKLVHPSDLERVTATLEDAVQTGTPIDIQFRILIGDDELKWLHTKAKVTVDPDGRPVSALGVTQDITERMFANEQLRASEARFRQLAENLEEAFWVSDPLVNKPIYLGPAAEVIWGRSLEELTQFPNAYIDSVLPEDKPHVLNALEKQADGERTNLEYRIRRPDGTVRWVWDRSFPIQGEGGYLNLVAGLAADITDRKLAEARIQQQLQRLSALSAIDNVISASLDMDMTLNVFLTETMIQLKVDAADVLLLNPYMQTLEFAVGQGFRTKTIQNSKLQLGDGMVGRAVLERRMIHIPDLSGIGVQFARAEFFRDEGFSAYFGLPLVAKGQLKGVLEIFHRLPFDPDPEWFDYLKTLAAEAAIAIDNAQLFDQMQKSNLELTMAYDATIAGWSRAMDLRDKETEGHTQRVTQLTLRLAERMGISKQELVHIRRGSLLHDIGKLGVPDQILLKPGKLTDAEWDIMRMHPTYAYEMLYTINYLRPALDIPYCHHEKWDGTGYPQRLKGEQIPFAARIFAVVDVWDALHSDRPYRPGWPVEKIREFIREQSGQHFEPRVVDAFLSMLDESPDL